MCHQHFSPATVHYHSNEVIHPVSIYGIIRLWCGCGGVGVCVCVCVFVCEGTELYTHVYTYKGYINSLCLHFLSQLYV